MTDASDRRCIRAHAKNCNRTFACGGGMLMFACSYTQYQYVYAGTRMRTRAALSAQNISDRRISILSAHPCSITAAEPRFFPAILFY